MRICDECNEMRVSYACTYYAGKNATLNTAWVLCAPCATRHRKFHKKGVRKLNTLRRKKKRGTSMYAKMKAALEFYARPHNWMRMGEGAYADLGTKARQALRK